MHMSGPQHSLQDPVPLEDSDQHVQPRLLIKDFAGNSVGNQV